LLSTRPTVREPTIAGLNQIRDAIAHSVVSAEVEFRTNQKAAADFLAFSKSVRKAIRLIEEDRLKWLLKFAQREEFGATEKLGIEALAFALGGSQPHPPREAERLSEKQLSELSGRTRSGIVNLLKGYSWRAQNQALVFEISAHPKGSATRLTFGGPLSDCFMATAMQLVANEISRIRICRHPACGTLLLRKGRSEYCSTKCSSKERYNRWRVANFQSNREFNRWRNDQRRKRTDVRRALTRHDVVGRID
jgi:hypothetical protein